MSTLGANQVRLESQYASAVYRTGTKVKHGSTQVSSDYSKATEQVLNLLDSIAECLPRFEVYEKLQSDDILQVALLKVFTDVVDFSVRTFRFYKQNAIGLLY